MDQFAAPTEAHRPAHTSAETLKRHVDAIRKLRDEQRELSDALAFCYAAVKSDGFDKELVKLLVKRLDSDRAEITDKEDLLHLYESWYYGDITYDEGDVSEAVKRSRARVREKLDA